MVAAFQASETAILGYQGEPPFCRNYLLDQPARSDDHDNPCVKMVGNGLRPNVWMPFKKRFNIQEIYELYAASDGNIGFTNFFNFDNTVGFSPVPYAIVKYDKEAEAPVRDKKGRMIKVKRGEIGLLQELEPGLDAPTALRRVVPPLVALAGLLSLPPRPWSGVRSPCRSA